MSWKGRVSATFGLINRTDELLEVAWRERKWTDFVTAWSAAIVSVMIVALVLPFIMFLIPALIYNAVAVVTGAKLVNLSIFDLWDFGWRLTAMVGIVAVIFTVPAMLIRELFGDLKSS